MPISKKITSLKEPLDVDLQLIASDLDTSVKDMFFLSKTILEDGIQSERFDKLCQDIETEEGNEIISFDDNTLLYDFLDEAIVVHESLGVKYVIFDSLVTSKLECRFNSYK